MVAWKIDDKPSDTLVVGLRLNVLDEEFDSPPSPPNLLATFCANRRRPITVRQSSDLSILPLGAR